VNKAEKLKYTAIKIKSWVILWH